MESRHIDWEALYRRAYPSVYRALVGTLMDLDLAEDALHDAVLEGLRRPPARDDNLSGWLFRVAVRKARHGRRRTRAVTEITTNGRSELEAVLDRLSVIQLLRLLTQRQREIVIAFFYLDQTQEQIAQLLGIRRGTVAATISQALARMRKGEGSAS